MEQEIIEMKNIVKNELTACNMTQLFVIPISVEFTTR